MTAPVLLSQIRGHGPLPKHIAIIMDGNGRWARERMLPRPMGHRQGMKGVREVVEGAIEAGVEVLSLFAFSQENWQRPATEIGALMSLLEEYIQREADELEAQGVRVQMLGDLDRLAPPARAAVDRVMAQTATNSTLVLNLFISYGSRAEIVRAARRIAEEVAAGMLRPDQVDEAAISARLFTEGCPDPDLLIRTSGERRISNFLLWQLAYTELHISPVLWPDFTRVNLYEAILDYQTRDRRFGRVSV
ncbi:MAG: isoprenyl transferase [Gemmatimonadota bacterium]|jgi:undecaprenyl diphosphate synthase|nr:isoprenyl transferase [Gemmatimonadota bacterium]MDQ8149967.1 isoprenyl transferase [Gemmatimonadota bacterium]MDQ8152163.1 isoprenyl transferase [Gemmatimonadota bacterium]MDQ8170445.1 isoprenyl transferase [Gemmatimonadota bacterium]MDQ8175624.1 isoprenyl transferase [Gemmatimonadota bacterium]